jgi:hypothetical protein
MRPSILPDGCVPPYWPRPPWPPVPEPEPDSLDESVNWMTYSHPELYQMVHSGIDLTGAMAVSAKWARLGNELEEIADELARLLAATAEAWQGEAAELATGSVAALSDWSRNTSVSATDVSGCITVQVDNATNARNNMPAPPYPVIQPAEPPASSVDAFTSGDFGTARSVVADPMIYTDRERALHQQAAQTMRQFQAESRDVYGSLPQFAPPDLRAMPNDPFLDPEVPTPPPTTPQDNTPGPGTPTPGTPGGGSGSSGGYGGGSTVPPAERVPGGIAAGGSIGGGLNEPGAQRPAAAAAAPGRPGGGPVPAGGMPMGAPGGSRGGDDTERKHPSYLEEDDDIWGANDKRAMPPVIGEIKRNA